MDGIRDALGCGLGGNPAACAGAGQRINQGVDRAIEGVANSALEQFVNALYEFALWILEIISTWWMNTPNADVQSAAVTQIQQDIQWYVMGFAMIGFLMGLIRMVSSQDIRQGLTTSFKPIVNLILVTGVYAAAVTMLLQAGDEGSMWLLSRATDGEADLSTMFMPASAGGGAAALIPMLLVYLLAGVGGIVNFVFMIFRNILLVVLMAFLPALAAATGTQRGDQAFAKANGWLLALLLFKPVAAGIYALGFRFMRSDTDMGLDDELATAVDQLTGAGIILLAALALPALIKFLVPAAAIGAGAFTGGAAIGAGVGVAAGAAVLASTGGAGAAAAGGGSNAAVPSGSNQTSSSGSTADGAGADASSGGSNAAVPSGSNAGAGAASGSGGGTGSSSTGPGHSGSASGVAGSGSNQTSSSGSTADGDGADASSGGSNAAVPSGSNAGSGAASGSGGGTGSSSTGPGHSGSASGVAGSGSNQTSSSGSSADGGGAAPVGGGAAAAPAGHSASASPEGASGSTAGSSSTAAAGGGAASSGASTPGGATAGGSQGSSGANAGDAVRAADAGRGIAAEGSSDDGADDEEGGRP